MVDKSLSLSDFVKRERLDDFNECSLVDEDFFPESDDDLKLFVKDLESFFEVFCECLFEGCF